MKKIYTALTLLLFSGLSLSSFAQNFETESEGGSYSLEINSAEHPCISAQEYEWIEKRCAENIQLLGLTNNERGTNSTTLSFPLKPATALTDCGYYHVSAGVDQNTATGAIKDYNCGTATYDGHGGTDFSIWPYNFYKMDNNLVEVIAAAPGTILYKSDGHFDKYCASNSDTANYIIIRHADGSQANYFHMKKNSVTTKTVGQTVVTGEHLGFVGSSGNSSGPHLHFEVWSGSTSATRIDPFSGACNTLNANSWWASQIPYNKTEVIKASVNTTDIVVPTCPATETPNESSSFQIPFQGAGLSAGYAKFYIFILNDTAGINVNLSILNPNGSVFNSWRYTSTVNYKTSYRSWSKLLPTAAGIYTFKASYNGTVCSTTFTITTATDISDFKLPEVNFALYPNPAKDYAILQVNKSVAENLHLSVIDILGRKIIDTSISVSNGSYTINTAGFSSGLYLVNLYNDKNKLFGGKLSILNK